MSEHLAPTSEMVDVAALLRKSDAAYAAAYAAKASPEEERAVVAAAEALAGSEAGEAAKSRKAICSLARKTLHAR